MAFPSDAQRAKQRREEDRQRAREEERRQAELDRRQEEERQLQREEERRQEALQQAQEFEAALEAEQQRRAAALAKVRQQKRLERRSAARGEERRDLLLEILREANRQARDEEQQELARREENRQRLSEERQAEQQQAARQNQQRQAAQNQRQAEQQQSERQEQLQAERREANLQAQRISERETEQAEARREIVRQQRLIEQLAGQREAERASQRAETRRAEALRLEADAQKQEEARAERRAEEQQAAREEEREAELRQVRRDQARQQASEEERLEAARQSQREARQQERQEAERQAQQEAERREAVRQARLDQQQEAALAAEQAEARRAHARQARADEQRQTDRAAQRRADARVETSRPVTTRPPLEARIPSGVLSGSLPWLRNDRNQIRTLDGAAVTLRGVNLLGLDGAPPDAERGFAAGAGITDALLDPIFGWNVNVVRVAINQQRVMAGDCLADVDHIIERAAASGAYTLLSLRRLDDITIFGTTPGANGARAANFIAPQPGYDAIEMWRLLGERYAEEPAVLFDLYAAPHAALPDDLTGFDTDWDLWTLWTRLTVAELRRLHPRALCFVCGLDWGADLSGFPVPGTEGLPIPNLVYSARLFPQRESPLAALRALARTQPVFVSEWGGTQADIGWGTRTATALRALGIGWTAAHWNAQPPLVQTADNRFAPTAFGAVVRRELAMTGERLTAAPLDTLPGLRSSGLTV